jgi:hypothetical protein
MVVKCASGRIRKVMPFSASTLTCYITVDVKAGSFRYIASALYPFIHECVWVSGHVFDQFRSNSLWLRNIVPNGLADRNPGVHQPRIQPYDYRRQHVCPGSRFLECISLTYLRFICAQLLVDTFPVLRLTRSAAIFDMLTSSTLTQLACILQARLQNMTVGTHFTTDKSADFLRPSWQVFLSIFDFAL